jgi:hypothetical protein
MESQSHKSALSRNSVDVSTYESHFMATFGVLIPTSMKVYVYNHYDPFPMVGPDGLANVFY